MDTINGLAQVFGNGFFPVIMCVVFIVGIYYLVKMHKDEIQSLSSTIDKNTDVINKMTVTLQQLSDRVENLEHGKEK